MRFLSLICLLFCLVFITGCGGSGSGTEDIPLQGNWEGQFSGSSGGIEKSAKLSVEYTKSGDAVSGAAILTLGSGSEARSYQGDVSGTFGGGKLEANIELDPALPDGVSMIHLTAEIVGDILVGTYSAGTNSGTFTQFKVSSSPQIGKGYEYSGTLTLAEGGETEPISFSITSKSGNSFSGVMKVNGVSANYAGFYVVNRIMLGGVLDGTIGVQLAGSIEGTKISGAFTSTNGGLTNSGTFVMTRTK